MSSPVAVILEHLAATRWFAAHGEVALTAGLTFCLEKDPAAAQAFMKLIRDRTGLAEETIPAPDHWKAEIPDDEHMRLDVAGLLDNENAPVPIVLVEAKVSARFAPRQVSTYVSSQKVALERAGVAHGVFAVLVPVARVRAARDEVALDLQSLGVTARDQAWLADGASAVTVTVISWDEAVEAMLADAGLATGDLLQLLGACRALQGADVTAFTEADIAGKWRDRKDDLRLIIDRVTRVAIERLSLELLPWRPNPAEGLEGGYRYLGQSGLPNLAVGMRLDNASPPLWVRWHWRTADVRLVELRLAEGHTVVKHEGHLWLPLDLKPDVGVATRQIESLVSQVVDLYKTAVGTEPV